jgi:2-polyprenyl-3-methyl-5-hydroxy-6-metoxy-1,4-benzoquinol methylase
VRRYQAAWERWARREPYYAVLTEERYRGAALDAAAREAFFASGSAYRDFLFEILRKRFERIDPPRRILDFGCGVGRLAIPFAQSGARVIGIDVSPAMLEEARRNAASSGVESLELVRLDSLREEELGELDLINSYITLQHVPEEKGFGYLRNLLGMVAVGGFAAIHLLHTRPGPAWRRIASRLRTTVPGLNAVANLMQRQPSDAHFMQMNAYDMNRLLDLLYERGFTHSYCVLTDHGGFRGVLVVAERVTVRVP